MYNILVESLAMPLICLGVFFFMMGTLGLLRFPDIYCRVHASTKCDTFGAGVILVALALLDIFSINALKLLLIFFFITIYSPTAGHLISRAAFRRRIPMWRRQPKANLLQDKSGD